MNWMNSGKGFWMCFAGITFTIMVLFSMSSCDVSAPTVASAPTGNSAMTTPPTATDTPTPTYPAPILANPMPGATIVGEKLTNFSWQWDGDLQEGEKFDLRIWRAEKPCCTVEVLDECSYLLDTPPDGFGQYQWQVAVVRIDEGDNKLTLCESPIWPFVWSDVPTPTPTHSTSTPTPTNTSTSTSTATPTATATHTPRPPTLTPVPNIALTIYLRRSETDFTALDDDQANAEMIYEKGQCVYGDAAVQIGETTYHFDKPEVEPGEPEQLPDPWRVEFEFAEKLKAHTKQSEDCAPDGAGFNPKKAWFWVGTLDSDSAMEDHAYSLTMKLYEGDEVQESIQVSFTVAYAPGGGDDGGGDGGGSSDGRNGEWPPSP